MLLRTMGATVGRYGVREATQPRSLNLKAAPTKQEVGREVLPTETGMRAVRAVQKLHD